MDPFAPHGFLQYPVDYLVLLDEGLPLKGRRNYHDLEVVPASGKVTNTDRASRQGLL